MQTPLDDQCSDAPGARPLPAWLRKAMQRLHVRPAPGRPHGRASAPAALAAETPSLPTPAELEALRWTMDGMTDTEIARHLGLPDQVIALRLQSVMRKLGCKTKYETVLTAITLRLIEAP